MGGSRPLGGGGGGGEDLFLGDEVHLGPFLYRSKVGEKGKKKVKKPKVFYFEVNLGGDRVRVSLTLRDSTISATRNRGLATADLIGGKLVFKAPSWGEGLAISDARAAIFVYTALILIRKTVSAAAPLAVVRNYGRS